LCLNGHEWAKRQAAKAGIGYQGLDNASAAAAADRAAGYRYDVSILQAEFSLPPMLDKPVSGWVFFEQVIGDNLDTASPTRSGWCSTAISFGAESILRRGGSAPE
jgi:hypothetical protein